MGQVKNTAAARGIRTAAALYSRLRNYKKQLNDKMEGRYSPSLIAMFVAAGAAFFTFVILFFPNYLGVANDGSGTEVMNSAGIYYLQDNVSDNYNGYFVKSYSNVLSGPQVKGTMQNSHVMFVKAALRLDNLVTHDRIFDIRFLALIYTVFYIPAVYLIVRQACMRVRKFSEGCAIGGIGLILFSDVAYVTYFNSFYPEAVWFISLLYITAAAISFQEDRSMAEDIKSLLLLAVSGFILMSSRKICALTGILLALYCIKLIFGRSDWKWWLICILAAIILSAFSIACMIRMESDFNETSKFHAMTRGVLFGSDNPARTLEEFDIDASYEVLADASSYDGIPFVEASDPVLEEGFLDRYTTMDIGLYYIRHPGKFIGMADLAIKSCFGIRRETCGNYEKSVGLPPGARSIFWSLWSTFKNSSAPKTIGFLGILAAASVFLFGKGYSVRPADNRGNVVLLDCMIVLFILCMGLSMLVIIQSGDAEMIRHCFLISASIDIMAYFVFADLVHRIKIF